jgi:hypothetical protein
LSRAMIIVSPDWLFGLPPHSRGRPSSRDGYRHPLCNTVFPFTLLARIIAAKFSGWKRPWVLEDLVIASVDALRPTTNASSCGGGHGTGTELDRPMWCVIVPCLNLLPESPECLWLLTNLLGALLRLVSSFFSSSGLLDVRWTYRSNPIVLKTLLGIPGFAPSAFCSWFPSALLVSDTMVWN